MGPRGLLQGEAGWTLSTAEDMLYWGLPRRSAKLLLGLQEPKEAVERCVLVPSPREQLLKTQLFTEPLHRAAD